MATSMAVAALLVASIPAAGLIAVGTVPPADSVTRTSEAPSLGTWRSIAVSPLSPRSEPVSVWTGRELVVWSGIPELSDMCDLDEGGGLVCGQPAVFDGAAYDPVTDTWRTIADGPVSGWWSADAGDPASSVDRIGARRVGWLG